MRTSGGTPWASRLGYWSPRSNSSRGLPSGPMSLGQSARMHCFRLATADRPQSSLKGTMAFWGRRWTDREREKTLGKDQAYSTIKGNVPPLMHVTSKLALYNYFH